MANGIRNVTRDNPCPICGKPDWCGWVPTERGAMILCQRDTKKESTVGFDGRQYVYVCDSKSGTSLYEEWEQYSKRDYVKARAYQSHRKVGAACRQAQDSAPKSRTPVNIIEPRSNEDLDQIYRALRKDLKLKPEHRAYLKKQGWTDEMITTYGVVSFPESDSLRATYKRRDINPTRTALAEKLIGQFGDQALLGVPGAYKKENRWTFNGPSGILFPMYDLAGKIYRLRIRMDFRDQKAQIFSGSNGRDDYFLVDNQRNYISMKGVYLFANGEKSFLKQRGKYRTLSSYKEDEEELKKGFIKNIYDCGCGSKNEMSHYKPANCQSPIVIITEGEPKAAFAAAKLQMEVWSLPGVNSFHLAFSDDHLEHLRASNSVVLVAFDADKATNETVLKMEQNLLNGLKERNIPCGTVEWDGSIGKGIDDNLAAGGTLRFLLNK